MAITTKTLPDGSIQTTNTDDATGLVLWVSIAPDPASPQVVGAANQATLQTKAQAALAANINDVTQDQAIQTQAATITAASITNLATAATAIGKLAQAVSVLAGNDINSKKELQALVRLVLQQFDSTTGT